MKKLSLPMSLQPSPAVSGTDIKGVCLNHLWAGESLQPGLSATYCPLDTTLVERDLFKMGCLR